MINFKSILSKKEECPVCGEQCISLSHKAKIASIGWVNIVSADDKKCPECGAKLLLEFPPKVKAARTAVLCAIILMIIMSVVGIVKYNFYISYIGVAIIALFVIIDRLFFLPFAIVTAFPESR